MCSQGLSKQCVERPWCSGSGSQKQVWLQGHILVRFWVAEWPPFSEGAANSVDHIFSLCFDYLSVWDAANEFETSATS